MPVEAMNSRSKIPSSIGIKPIGGHARRIISRLPVVGPACRWLKHKLSQTPEFRLGLSKVRFRRPTESEQVLELQRQIVALNLKLRAHQPLFNDYQSVCRRVVELEDELLRANDPVVSDGATSIL